MPEPPLPRTPPHSELVAFYGQPAQRPQYLRRLFDETAPDYDRILQYSFLGTGDAYRRRALREAGLAPGMRLLDVACGTGLVAAQALKCLRPADLVCVDPSPGMRRVARAKLGEKVTILGGRAEALPVRDESFDMITMGYALRHVASLEEMFGACRRVLKPGGKLLLLEISRPARPAARALLRVYMRDLVPLISGMVARSAQARTLMRYFWESIDHCVPPETILEALARSGFHAPRRRTELGIFSAYTAVKP